MAFRRQRYNTVLFTWSQWRGYGEVKVRSGGVGAMRTESSTLYLRGMHGDWTNVSGTTTRTVSVADGEGGSHPDLDGLEGYPLKTTVFDKPGGTVASKSVNTPWLLPTATRTFSWRTLSAAYSGIAATRSWTALESGTWRQTGTDFTHDPVYGLPTQVNDLGDLADPADDRCTRTTYATPNTTSWLIDYASRQETVATNCEQTPDRAKQVISDVRTYYDNTALGGSPTLGRITKSERLISHDGQTGAYQTLTSSTYDAYGRVLTVADAFGRTTTTLSTSQPPGLPPQPRQPRHRPR